jgi:hypothetical protein
MDWVYLIILAILVMKTAKHLGNGIGDFVASFVGAFLLYAAVKLPFHCLISGWTFPVSANPTTHLISGSIAFAILAPALYYGVKRKENPSLPPLHKVYLLLRR